MDTESWPGSPKPILLFNPSLCNFLTPVVFSNRNYHFLSTNYIPGPVQKGFMYTNSFNPHKNPMR